VGKFFFENAWNQPAADPAADVSAELMELVRWAPSAVNKQPWRIIRKDGLYHFYEKKDNGYVSNATGDLQKIDVGIALCHFMMGMEEHGDKPCLAVDNPGLEVPENVEYIATVKK
jgi:hypothetical protein